MKSCPLTTNRCALGTCSGSRHARLEHERSAVGRVLPRPVIASRLRHRPAAARGSCRRAEAWQERLWRSRSWCFTYGSRQGWLPERAMDWRHRPAMRGMHDPQDSSRRQMLHRTVPIERLLDARQAVIAAAPRPRRYPAGASQSQPFARAVAHAAVVPKRKTGSLHHGDCACQHAWRWLRVRYCGPDYDDHAGAAWCLQDGQYPARAPCARRKNSRPRDYRARSRGHLGGSTAATVAVTNCGTSRISVVCQKDGPCTACSHAMACIRPGGHRLGGNQQQRRAFARADVDPFPVAARPRRRQGWTVQACAGLLPSVYPAISTLVMPRASSWRSESPPPDARPPVNIAPAVFRAQELLQQPFRTAAAPRTGSGNRIPILAWQPSAKPVQATCAMSPEP